MSWSAIHGHRPVLERLKQAVVTGRLGHAYLLAGPEGVGKRTVARELAKALLCEQPQRTDPFTACDACTACHLVSVGNHPDLLETGRADDANQLSIDVVRGVTASLELKPARGTHRIAILDDADVLNEEASNGFLKTLEEPPPGSLLVLIGTEADLQLPTIRSRCQVIRFGALPAETVSTLLRQRDVPADQVERLVALGGGSPGQALALADPALWQFRSRLLNGLTVARPDTVTLAREFVAFATEPDEGAAKRRRTTLVLRLLLDALGTALKLSAGDTPTGVDPVSQALARRYDPEVLLELIERGLDADRQVGRFMQLALIIEAYLDTFARLAPVAGR
jgi:DNA polymerase-3 subunit delta'